MFVNKDWLAEQLASGRSFGDIGRELGRDDSTVAYWAKKHGLQPSSHAKYRPRGAPDRSLVEDLIARNASLSEIASVINRSISTLRYWLDKWDIAYNGARRKRVDPSEAPVEMESSCATHGLTTFRLEGRGYYRCKRCRQDRVSDWRRRVKRLLVSEAGGACRLCGYDYCVAALQFHHLDPTQKAFTVSRRGSTRSLAEARSEAAKCVLLCANCHAEVENGVRQIELPRAA